MITIERIREMFDYDPSSGSLLWRKHSRRPDRIGKEAGASYGSSAHRRVTVDGKRYMKSWIVWAHYYGEFPSRTPDHEDNNSANDRIGNLRLATKAQNAMNSKIRSDSSTGLKGVSYIKRTGHFYASIYVSGRTINLGRYMSKLEAHAAYIAAAEKYFGEFARPHG